MGPRLAISLLAAAGALACATSPRPATGTYGLYFVTDSAPDGLRYGDATWSLPSAGVFVEGGVSRPCLRECAPVRASASYQLVGFDSGAKVSAMARAPRVGLPRTGRAVTYRDAADHSVLIFVLGPGSPDSLTVRVKPTAQGNLVGNWCVGACPQGFQGKAIALLAVQR
jgi:hypothetical protein